MTNTATITDHGGCESHAREEPYCEREQRDDDDGRHENRRHAICQSLNGRLRALCLFHQANDLRENGFCTHGARLDLEQPLSVDRCADDAVTHLLIDRQLSPVSIDSSTAEVPSSTMPSTGICSPGRTITMSLTRTCG